MDSIGSPEPWLGSEDHLDMFMRLVQSIDHPVGHDQQHFHEPGAVLLPGGVEGLVGPMQLEHTVQQLQGLVAAPEQQTGMQQPGMQQQGMQQQHEALLGAATEGPGSGMPGGEVAGMPAGGEVPTIIPLCEHSTICMLNGVSQDAAFRAFVAKLLQRTCPSQAAAGSLMEAWGLGQLAASLSLLGPEEALIGPDLVAAAREELLDGPSFKDSPIAKEPNNAFRFLQVATGRGWKTTDEGALHNFHQDLNGLKSGGAPKQLGSSPLWKLFHTGHLLVGLRCEAIFKLASEPPQPMGLLLLLTLPDPGSACPHAAPSARPGSTS